MAASSLTCLEPQLGWLEQWRLASHFFLFLQAASPHVQVGLPHMAFSGQLDFLRGGWFSPRDTVQRKEAEVCRPVRLCLQLTQGHFCCTLFVKVVKGPAQIQGVEKCIPPLGGKILRPHCRRPCRMGDTCVAITETSVCHRGHP